MGTACAGLRRPKAVAGPRKHTGSRPRAATRGASAQCTRAAVRATSRVGGTASVIRDQRVNNGAMTGQPAGRQVEIPAADGQATPDLPPAPGRPARIQSRRPPLTPHLDPEVIALFEALDDSTRYFEWGAGGSTKLAAMSGAEMVISVESKARWIENVMANRRIKEALAAGRFRLHHADIGPTRKWGYPVQPVTREQAAGYHSRPWFDELALAPDARWFVLVDGRFRTACALNVVLSGVRGTMVIDDYVMRDEYAELVSVIGEPELISRSALWRLPIASFDRAAATALLEQVYVDPR